MPRRFQHPNRPPKLFSRLNDNFFPVASSQNPLRMCLCQLVGLCTFRQLSNNSTAVLTQSASSAYIVLLVVSGLSATRPLRQQSASGLHSIKNFNRNRIGGYMRGGTLISAGNAYSPTSIKTDGLGDFEALRSRESVSWIEHFIPALRG